MANIPRPDGFANWQDWAERVLEVMDTDTGGATTAPNFAPPAQFVFTAAGASYAVTGFDASMVKDQPLASTNTLGVTTFHSISVYWNPVASGFPAPGVGVCALRYKRSGDADWRRGLDLWYDARSPAPHAYPARGSIVHCDSNMQYFVQVGLYQSDGAIQWKAQLASTQTKTWNETFTLASDNTFAAGTIGTQIISSGGSAGTGYARWKAPATGGASAGGTTISNGGHVLDSYCIRVSASYVYIKDVWTRGGCQGVMIDPGVHHVIIDNCDIADFGSTTGQINYAVGGERAVDEHSNGVSLLQGGGGGNKALNRTTTNIIVQRCKIHDPTYGSSVWDEGHPFGPNGIWLWESGGNNVFRYNEIYVTGDNTQKLFDDGISGGNNDSEGGAPGPDTDIYMNKVSGCTDDGIETEGSGCNVRVWKNYIDKVGGSHLASTPVEVGPLYTFRNVCNHSRFTYSVNAKSIYPTDSDSDYGKGFKVGEFVTGNTLALDGIWGRGRRYIFHNTLLQDHSSHQLADTSIVPATTYGQGAGQALSEADNRTTDTWTRNNILHSRKNSWECIFTNTTSQFGNDFDYDLYCAGDQIGGNTISAYAGAESHGFNAVPAYKNGHGVAGADAGNFQLQPGTAGHDAGQKLYNFNDDMPAPFKYLGNGPDCGAHEEGSDPMVFGVLATGS